MLTHPSQLSRTDIPFPYTTLFRSMPIEMTMFNDFSSPFDYLLTRRSAKPRDLIAPGPDAHQIKQILTAALRTPDHGKLAPWRFIIVGPDQRQNLAELL